MIADLFLKLLLICIAIASFSLIFMLIHNSSHRKNFLNLAKTWLLVSNCFAIIVFSQVLAGFINDDFSLAYVAEHSNKNLPLFYKISATWAGHQGSLLIWMCLTSILAYYTVSYIAPRLGNTGIIAGLFLNLITGIFAFILLAVTPLFETNQLIPSNGKGLSSALQSPFILIHPPLIFASYTAFSQTFALAISPFFCKGEDKKEGFFLVHLAYLRRWGLLTWLGLTLSILLGSLWSFQKFNGQYWQWNPLENMALATWLMLGGWIHLLVKDKQKGRQSLKSLIFLSLAYMLPLIGSYLVRKGFLIPGQGGYVPGYFFAAFALVIAIVIVKLCLARASADQFLLAAVIILSCSTLLVLAGSSLLLPSWIFNYGLTPMGIGTVLLLATGFSGYSFKTRLSHLGVILLLAGFLSNSLFEKVIPAVAPLNFSKSFKPDILESPFMMISAAGLVCILLGMLIKTFEKNPWSEKAK